MSSFASAMVIIPIYPEMLHTIECSRPELVGDELNNLTAGFFNGCVGIGEAVGPLMASLVASSLSFRRAEDVIAIAITIYCILFFFIVGRF